jgi:hypothetical protein
MQVQLSGALPALRSPFRLSGRPSGSPVAHSGSGSPVALPALRLSGALPDTTIMPATPVMPHTPA